jgi:transposase
MAVRFKSSSRRKSRPHVFQKPRGVLHPRVQAVGPEHFGIVCVDCAKARSKFMLVDFYGRVLIEPTTIAHNRFSLDAAVQSVRDARARHKLKDVIVVVERTGRYHKVVQRTFTEAEFEVRVVHPFATKQFRQPADPGNKTDDTDLFAIYRATITGFGLSEPKPDPVFARLKLLVRHRRYLVRRRTAVQLKMRDHLEACMPGYSDCVSDLFDSDVAMWVAKNLGSAEAIANAGVIGLVRRLSEAGVRKNVQVVQKIVAWASSAPSADEAASFHHRFFVELDEDQISKRRRIEGLEAEIAEYLALTPYVLLLIIPGINVVSAAEFAGEAGPIERYPSARAITGRAGLYPSRYQSDQVDRRDGKLIRCANRDLRYALMLIADNLLKCNNYFRVRAQFWKLQDKDPRDARVKVAGRFSRIGFQVVGGRQVCRHPCARPGDYVLDKLIEFSAEHEIPPDQLRRILTAAADQLPQKARRQEAIPLQDELARVRKHRGAGPLSLGEILSELLAKLGVPLVRSNESGESDLTKRPS